MMLALQASPLFLPVLLAALGGSLVTAVITLARGTKPTTAERWQRYLLDQRKLLEPGPGNRRRATGDQEVEAARAAVQALLADPGAIQAVFQPIVDMASGTVVGVEALSRMQGELDRSPGPWFKAASVAGLLIELELATIKVALASLAEIPPGLYVSINVSPGTVPASLADQGWLVAGDLDLERLVVEITERELIEDYNDLLQALTAPRQRGVRIGIDDLGTGFAGLSHVLGLEPDIIKLDVSLTAGIDRDPVRRALASSIVQFCREVEVALVAEGVETVPQRDALIALGVRYGQGFLFRRPAPLPKGSTVVSDD